MYNFGLTKGENVIEIFDDIWICQGKNEKNTTVAVTNKRILFMDYDKYDPNEVFRVGRGVDYVRYKEVYYQINLDEIISIESGDYYNVFLSNGVNFGFDDEKLYELINKK